MREGDRQTDRDRDTETERQRQRDRETETETESVCTCHGSKDPPLEGGDKLSSEHDALEDAEEGGGLSHQVVEVETVAKHVHR